MSEIRTVSGRALASAAAVISIEENVCGGGVTTHLSFSEWASSRLKFLDKHAAFEPEKPDRSHVRCLTERSKAD